MFAPRMRLGLSAVCLALLLCPQSEADAGLDGLRSPWSTAFVGSLGSSSGLSSLDRLRVAGCKQRPQLARGAGLSDAGAPRVARGRGLPAISKLSMEEDVDWEPEVLVPERVLQVKSDNGFKDLLSYAEQCGATVCIEFRQEFCRKCMAIAPKFRKLPAVYSARGVMFAEVDAVKISPSLRAELGLKVVPKFEIRQHGQIMGEYIAGKNIGMVMHDVIDMIEDHVPADEFHWPGSGSHSEALKKLLGETVPVSASTVAKAKTSQKTKSLEEQRLATGTQSVQVPVHETPIEIEELFEDVAGRAFNDAMLYTEDVAARFYEEQEWLEQLAAQKDPDHLGNSVSDLQSQLEQLEQSRGDEPPSNGVQGEVSNGVRATSGQLSNGKKERQASGAGAPHGGFSADELRAQLESMQNQ
mmetsp:Transcript_14361/g.22277  ORF Transcript_14361/g.22277 Transcript_14361/m.22277 type:complete len:413 (-) Transcript_14361:855-2093(-)